jgi:hypothetical protein
MGTKMYTKSQTKGAHLLLSFPAPGDSFRGYIFSTIFPLISCEFFERVQGADYGSV